MFVFAEPDEPETHAGYVAHKVYKPSGAQIVVYVAAEQGIDSGARYAVVCSLHSTILGESTKRSALRTMRAPEFCEECWHDSPALSGARSGPA